MAVKRNFLTSKFYRSLAFIRTCIYNFVWRLIFIAIALGDENNSEFSIRNQMSWDKLITIICSTYSSYGMEWMQIYQKEIKQRCRRNNP